MLVPLIMLVYQHSLAGDIADEVGHHIPCWQGTTAPESCSVSILICHTCQVDGLSCWILTNVCSTSERSNYFVYIQKKNFKQLFTSTCERNRCNKQSVAFIFLYICAVFTVCFRCPQMTPKSCRFEACVQ